MFRNMMLLGETYTLILAKPTQLDSNVTTVKVPTLAPHLRPVQPVQVSSILELWIPLPKVVYIPFNPFFSLIMQFFL